MLTITAFQFRSPDKVYRVDRASLTRLFSQHYQANHRLWSAVMALGDEQFTQTPVTGDGSIQTQIVHMIANENLWVNYLWHGEVEFLQASQFPTRASIQVEWDALEEEWCDFIDELTPFELERRISPPFLKPGTSLQVSNILLQIVQDAVESRARLHVQLHAMGIPTLSETPYLL